MEVQLSVKISGNKVYREVTWTYDGSDPDRIAKWLKEKTEAAAEAVVAVSKETS